MVVKTGVSLPDELYEKLAAVARSMGYTSISRAIRDAVELFIAFNGWWSSGTDLVGSIQVLAENAKTPQVLMAAQESTAARTITLDNIEGTGYSLVLVVVEGSAEEIKSLYRKLLAVRGAVVQPVLLPRPRAPSSAATPSHRQHDR